MSGKIVNLDEHRPHIALREYASDGTVRVVHVIPLTLVEAWGTGRVPLPENEILRAALSDWLWFLECCTCASADPDSA